MPRRAGMGKFGAVDLCAKNLVLHGTFTPIPGRESYSIDNTDVPAAEVGSMIIERFGLPGR